ncbi:MAG: hypothetical protein ACJA0U_002615 [Salibacteraceae bacterium]|jgi:hypothetical protein
MDVLKLNSKSFRHLCEIIKWKGAQLSLIKAKLAAIESNKITLVVASYGSIARTHAVFFGRQR